MRGQRAPVMGMGNHIRVSTTTGYGHVVLNRGQVLVSFYRFNGEPIGGIHLVPKEPISVYNCGWKVEVLKWIVDTFQPVIRHSVV